jgi:hypothetical protein
MALSVTVTYGGGNSTSDTITNEVSTLHVSGTFVGFITLQAAPTGTTDFVDVINVDQPKVLTLNTADTTMLYRVQNHLTEGSATVYLGA